MAAMPELNSSRQPSAASRRVADFWRWWRGEVSRMLPDRFASLGGGAPLLYIEGDEAVVIDPNAAPGSEERRAGIAGLDDARRKSAVRSLLESAGETRGRARAAVRHDQALVRRVTLPAATEENLSAVLAFEMDRLSPFKADEVYFDHRVVSRDAANGQIVVEMAIARREAIDARVRELRDLGVSVQGVALREDARRASAPFDLLPMEQRGERETPRERLVRNVLIAAVLVLFLATLLFPIWRKREAVVEMLPAVEKARHEAQATDAVVRELERQAADYNYLLARRHAWFPMAAYIEELSRLLPDNTWLQQLDIRTQGKSREVVLTGETASSSKLIELLEQSKMLQNASPRGPTTRGSIAGAERFMIGAELRPRTPPEAQPLAAASRPVAAPTPTTAVPQPATAVLQPVNPGPQRANPAPPPPTPPKSSGFGPFPKQ